MKIISKYKDFYDFITQDHDADLIYVRNVGINNEYLDTLFRKEGNSMSYYSRGYGYYSTDYYKHQNGDLIFDNIIFGIYPFVYSQPILKIYYKTLASNIEETINIVLGHDLVDKILDSNKEVSRKGYLELLSLAQKEYNEKAARGICKVATVNFNRIYELEDIKKNLKSKVWKVECKEIFYKINSPVFTKYNEDLFEGGPYWEYLFKNRYANTKKHIHYVTDISFQKLNYNILKYWYNELFDLNTYINIENFLWSIKQEPIANPDNKTKILSHGFDLKTSFRNIK